MIRVCKVWCRLARLLLAVCLARNIQAAMTVGRDNDEFRSPLFSVDPLSRIHFDSSSRPVFGRLTDAGAFPRSAGIEDGAMWRSEKARVLDELYRLWLVLESSELESANKKREDEEILSYKPESPLGVARLEKLDEIPALMRSSELDADDTSEPSPDAFAVYAEPSSEAQSPAAAIGGFERPLGSRFVNTEDYSEDRTLGSAGWLQDSGEPAEDVSRRVLLSRILHSVRSHSTDGDLLLPADGDDVVSLDRLSVPETLLRDSNRMSEATRESPIATPNKRDNLSRKDLMKLLHMTFGNRQPLQVEQTQVKKQPKEILAYQNRQRLIDVEKKGCSPSGETPELMTVCPGDASVCLHSKMLCDGRRDCPAGEDETAAVCFLRYWALVGLPVRLPLASRG